MSKRWQHYLDGNPEYLARHYWWAYLSPVGVWFFSHHIIINLILFGQYRRILDALTTRLNTAPCGRMLQLTCAYGELTPTLARLTDELHINDVALIQLRLAQKSLALQHRTAFLARMNAESLCYATDSFDTVVIFFLLHELPAAARQRALSETLRVLKPGGRLLIAEYAMNRAENRAKNRGRHLMHRAPWRWILEYLEPFLHDFWHSDLTAQLESYALQQGKTLSHIGTTCVFSDFFRVEEYSV